MTKFNLLRTLGVYAFIFMAAFLISCSDDNETAPEDPIASFQFAVSETNFLEVTFTNFSDKATSYSWDFGDNAGTSTDENPTYTYTETGEYMVTLTATNDAGVSVDKTETVTITDPLEAQRALFGQNGKVWQLIADPSTGVNPLQVGPNDRSQVWWSLGGVTPVCSRECIFDDTWTFNPDGSYTYENNGDYWAEGGVWGNNLNEQCFDATNNANYVNVDGTDISDWNSGTHSFAYDPTANTLTITGGFIGLTKLATDAEVTVPQASVTYSVVKLVDVENGVDTLILETQITAADGYWSIALVSYDDAASKVVVEECPTGGGNTIDAVNIDFESNPPTWTAFGGPNSDGSGVVQSTVANPVSGGINTSGMVGQLDEPDGSQGWTGISTVLDGKIDFTNKQTFKIKVYSPFAGAVVKLKLEDSADANNNKEIDMTTVAADTWEELTYTFATEDSGKWDVLVLFFDFQANAKTGARTHYFDDIILE